MALALANGEAAPAEDAPVAFTAGEYTATADGYNGPMTVKVTYTEDAISAIDVEETVETGHVGTLAYDIMIPEMIEANGSGVDAVAGATVSSEAVLRGVNLVIAAAE